MESHLLISTIRTSKGVYYLTRMVGQVDLMTKSLGLREQEEVGAIKLITDHLDGRIARHLDNCYASFAKPKAVMSVPECPVVPKLPVVPECPDVLEWPIVER